MTHPILESLKKYNSHFTADLFVNLNSDSDFGNLTLTYMQIVVRIECVNCQIIELYQKFNRDKQKRETESNEMFTLEDQYLDIMLTEQIFYWLRKTTDELISLISICADFKESGSYPKKIKISSIGEFLKLKKPFIEVVEKNKELLKLLNEISNTYKHSFINPQIMSLKGSEYPVVFAYNLQYNNLKSGANFIQIELKQFLNNYDKFLFEVKNYLIENFTM